MNDIKKIYFALIYFVVSLSALAAPKQLQMTLDFCRFYDVATQKSAIVFYLNVDAQSVRYKQQTKQQFKATVAAQITVMQQNKVVMTENFEVVSPIINDTTNVQGAFYAEKKIVIPHGNYQIKLAAKDVLHPQDSIFAEIPVTSFFADTIPAVSDIQMLASYDEKTQQKITYSGEFYPQTVHQIQFYTEIYGTLSKNNPEGTPFVVTYQIRKHGEKKPLPSYAKMLRKTAKKQIALISGLDITQLPSGNYWLEIEIRNAKNEVIAKQQKFFQRSNPPYDKEAPIVATNQSESKNFTHEIPDAELKKYIKALQPILNTKEQMSNTSILGNNAPDLLRKYLFAFWKKRNEKQPEVAFKNYAERLRIAENKYKAPGLAPYETDRGRVLLQYGIPNRIETEITESGRSALESSSMIPFEIWYYYDTEWLDQKSIFLVFVQEVRGDNNYKLVHSNAIGEIRNPEWRDNIRNGRRAYEMDRDDSDCIQDIERWR